MSITPQEVLASAITEHAPVKTYALFSGGNDSMVSTHFAMNNGADEVLHINTGIGVEETRVFVRETCRRYGWPLRVEHPPDKTYRDFVLSRGFPGPGAHKFAYSWLKERALRKVVRETKFAALALSGDIPVGQKAINSALNKMRVGLVTGVRNQESARRMGFVKPVVRAGAPVWIAPIYAFSKIDLHEYRTLHDLPQSEVSKKLGMSGECLCGAFASEGELDRIAASYPKVAAQIIQLQLDAKAAGKPCVWGKRPSKRVRTIDDAPLFMPMCVGCNDSKRMGL